MSTLTQGGTGGRVYGGNPNLIHIADGERGDVGAWLADELAEEMRLLALANGHVSNAEAARLPLCPGCYMIAGFNALVTLADRNGQPRTELARSMIGAFERLLANPDAGLTEEIEIMLDPCDTTEDCDV